MTQLKINPDLLRRIRDNLGRTQGGMAQIIGTTGTTWARWERGESTPLPIYQEKLHRLAQYVVGRQAPEER